MIQRKTMENQVTEIGSHERFVLGSKICYKLFLDKQGDCVGYRIRICREEEQAESFFGEDFLSVAVLFAELVRGEVLPYSLEEIAEDFLLSEKIYREKSE